MRDAFSAYSETCERIWSGLVQDRHLCRALQGVVVPEVKTKFVPMMSRHWPNQRAWSTKHDVEHPVGQLFCAAGKVMKL